MGGTAEIKKKALSIGQSMRLDVKWTRKGTIMTGQEIDIKGNHIMKQSETPKHETELSVPEEKKNLNDVLIAGGD